MKKLVILFLLFAACKSDSRTYVNHTDGQFSIADDTLIIEDTIVVNRTAYQRIHEGILEPKEFRVQQWRLHAISSPVIRFDGKHAFLNNTIYTQVP